MSIKDPTYNSLKSENEQLKKKLHALEKKISQTKYIQEKYQHIFNNSSEAIIIHDLEGNIIEVNDVACKRLGYDRETLLQMTPMDFDAKEDAEKAPDRIQKINKKGSLLFETHHIRKDGSAFPVEISSRIIQIDKKPYIISIASDISKRKEAETTRDEYQRHLSAALESIDSMLIIVDKDLRIVLCNWKDHEWVPEKERTKRPFCYKAMKNLDKPCSYCPPLKTFKDGKPRWYEDQNPLDGSYKEIDVKPIFDKQGNVEYVLENVKDVTKYKNIQEEISKREEDLRITLNSIGDAVISTDLKGKVTRINPVARKLTGWKEKDAIGKPLSKIFNIQCAITGKKAENPVKKVLETGKIVGLANHTVLISKSKKKYQIADSGAPIKDKKGNITGVVLVFRDVTENYNKQQEIKQTKDFLNAVFMSIQDGVSVLDKDLTIRYVNPVMEKWYTNRKPLIGKKCFTCYQNRDVPCDPCPSIRCMESGKTEFEVVQGPKDANANVTWIELYSYPIKDNDTGKITGVIEFVRDITKRKHAEDALAKNEKDLKNAQAIASVGSWTFNFNTGEVTASEEAHRIYGIEKNKKFTIPMTQKISLPGYRPMMDKALDDLIKKNKKYDIEFKIKRPSDGKIADIYSIAEYNKEENIVTGIIQDITKRKSTEEALRISEDRLSKTMQAANDGMWDWDLKTNHVYFDPRYYEMAGYKKDAFPHKLEEFQKRIHPENVDYVMNEAKDHLEGRKDRFIVEFRFKQKDGNWMWIMGRGFIVERDENNKPLRMVGTHTDITKRKTAEQALAAQKDRLANIIEGTNAGTWEWNVQTGETIFNERWAEFIGYTLEEISPTTVDTWMKYTHPDDLKKSNQLLKDHFKGKTDVYKCECRMKHKDGHWIWVFDRGKVISWTDDGKPLWMFGTHQDITSRKKNEEKVIRQNEEYEALNEEYYSQNEKLRKNLDYIQEINSHLEEAKEKAEESDRLKSAFLANMSHEIRTPMNGILGFTELLKTPELEGDKKNKYIELIQKSGRRMLNLINDLIDISKLEAGQVEVTMSPVNINEQIEYLYTFFKPEADKKGLQLNYKLGLKNEAAIIKTDKEKIYIILTNLIKNAIKYTNKGHIDIGYQLKNDKIEFYVEDTGIGINKNRQKAIFERFVQAELDIARPYEGAGLGLAITKAYVDMLEGKMWVDSKIHKGSCFCFNIAYKPLGRSDKKPDNTSKKSYNWKGKNILIVEDEPTSLEFLQESLSKTHAKIYTAETGRSALSIFQKKQEIDIILMDIRLPDISGHEVTKQIRKSNKKIPIIAQTAQAMSDDKQKCIQAGTNEYITKPIDNAKLMALIDKYL